MPTLDWVNKSQALEATRAVPILFAVAQADDGRNVEGQIADKIG